MPHHISCTSTFVAHRSSYPRAAKSTVWLYQISWLVWTICILGFLSSSMQRCQLIFTALANCSESLNRDSKYLIVSCFLPQNMNASFGHTPHVISPG